MCDQIAVHGANGKATNYMTQLVELLGLSKDRLVFISEEPVSGTISFFVFYFHFDMCVYFIFTLSRLVSCICYSGFLYIQADLCGREKPHRKSKQKNTSKNGIRFFVWP